MKIEITYCIIVILLVMLAAPVTVFAGFDQAKEGVIELLSAPIQIPVETARLSREVEQQPLSMIGGILSGSGLMVQKMCSGIVKIFTSPFTNLTY